MNDRDARGVERETSSSSRVRESEYLDGDRLIIYEVGDNWGNGTPHIIGIPVEVRR